MTLALPVELTTGNYTFQILATTASDGDNREHHMYQVEAEDGPVNLEKLVASNWSHITVTNVAQLRRPLHPISDGQAGGAAGEVAIFPSLSSLGPPLDYILTPP